MVNKQILTNEKWCVKIDYTPKLVYTPKHFYLGIFVTFDYYLVAMFYSYELFKGISVLIVTTQIIRSVFPWIYKNFIGRAIFGNSINFKKFGKWAGKYFLHENDEIIYRSIEFSVVTGAGDGIGKSYCEQLAKRGLNIVLVSRRLSKLEPIANEIETAYNVETKIIVVDFTKEEGIYEKIEASIEGLEIGILVNNVGMAYDIFNFFTSFSRKFYKDMINCNVVSMINMTRIVLPQMVDRKKGLIINISSGGSLIPAPLMIVYAASKAFVNKFSDDLRSEYKKQGITIQTVKLIYKINIQYG
jgi:17beta-estradiol 17-dehydrogenase / very-long-chain 3-oxoacyl-CoA reductase